MIISASRRTDIPAFYSEWFMNRISAGYCTVVNPFNRDQVKYVSLKPSDIDIIVFWTKHGKALRQYLPELDERGYNYYFQYTLIKYDRSIERKVPPFDNLKEEYLNLAEQIGPEKVIWRYDPIIISEQMGYANHLENFAAIAGDLKNHTKRVIISIVDYYRKTKQNLSASGLINLNETPEQDSEFANFIQTLSKIAAENNLEIQSCAEPIEMVQWGVPHGKCIDDEYIKKVFGIDVTHKKDTGQRKECGCVNSQDIGAYDTCLHGCQYCYATKSHDLAKKNYDFHDPKSPSIIGWYDAQAPEDQQLSLFK